MGDQGNRDTRSSSSSGLSDEIVRLLRNEKIVWVSTVRTDGRPGLVPIWFLWDGSAFLIFSKPDAQKVRSLRENPNVMLALGSPEADFDVQLVAGRAELLGQQTSEVLPAGLLWKYRREMRSVGLSPSEYASTYSQPIRVTPIRFLPWRGRSHLDATARRRRASGSVPEWASAVERIRGRLGRWHAEAGGWRFPAAIQVGGSAWAPLPAAATGPLG